MAHPFASTPKAQLESLEGLMEQFHDDHDARKIDLMVGVYKTNQGKAHVLPSVKKAKGRIFADQSWNHEYRESLIGSKGFRDACEKLLFGEKSSIVGEKRVVSMQTLGASGACHSAAILLRDHYAPWKLTTPRVYIPQESWTNHAFVFSSLNIGASFLPYYDPVTRGLNFTALEAEIENLPLNSVVVLQTGAQNPTGCDPSAEQWQTLACVFKERGHLAVFDAAYPGFASGDFDEDVYCLRLFTDLNIPVMVAATYGKCFGLYCERVGTLSIVVPDKDVRERMEVQMRLLARSETGPMPDFGSSIVETILNDQDLQPQWRQELYEMAVELQNRRSELIKKLDILGTPGDWSHITNQKGMFTYIGLSLSQIHHLRNRHHVYLQLSGRLSVAGLNSFNIDHVAKSIDETMRAIT